MKETLFCYSKILHKNLGLYLWIVRYIFGYFYLLFKMGGNLNRNEAPSCKNYKSEQKVWRRLHRYGFIDYIEKLHGKRNSVSHGFARGWSNNKVTLFKEIWQIDEDLVVEVMGLQREGTKFYRD